MAYVTQHGVRPIQIYQGGGKKPWDRKPNGYPPRPHDCMPPLTEFANLFRELQEDLERREKMPEKIGL